MYRDEILLDDLDVEQQVRENVGSLQRLADIQVLDEPAFARLRNQIADRIYESDGNLADQGNEYVDNNIRTGLVAMLNSEENGGLLEGFGNEGALETKSEFLGFISQTELNDPFSIRLLGLYTNFELVNTSELGVIHRHYVEDPDGTPLLLGKQNEDRSFIDLRFAYPELFDTGTHQYPDYLRADDDLNDALGVDADGGVQRIDDESVSD